MPGKTGYGLVLGLLGSVVQELTLDILPRMYVIKYSKLTDVKCFLDTPGWYLDEEGT